MADPEIEEARSSGKNPEGTAWENGAPPGWDAPVTYRYYHMRVVAARGRPAACEECGLNDLYAWFEWANMTGDYANVMDYRRLCRSCHRKMDDTRRGGRPWSRAPKN